MFTESTLKKAKKEAAASDVPSLEVNGVAPELFTTQDNGDDEEKYPELRFADSCTTRARLMILKGMSDDYFAHYVSGVPVIDDHLDLVLYEHIRRKFGGSRFLDTSIKEMIVCGKFMGEYDMTYNVQKWKVLVSISVPGLARALDFPLSKLVQALRLFRDREKGVVEDYIKLGFSVPQDDLFEKYKSVSMYFKSDQEHEGWQSLKRQNFIWSVRVNPYTDFGGCVAGLSWHLIAGDPILEPNN